jgi:hypothetical protein
MSKKRITLFSLLFALTFALAYGCGSENKSAKTPSDSFSTDWDGKTDHIPSSVQVMDI